ncbi:TRAP transporter small permease [Acidovorax sp. A1169]|jgi:TRAP-type C4-dicarboxylate transport system permease small subunit|uniref:TRAP transporter small permease n=1 Tax=Acidovorax sp. A1169 TaxID=3059524 RepID=UPI002737EFA4|nr:TRAP transporter small permease [Acidovorax sp. A1169]MDP4075436.1 TRAP transporter small permease [Acidovorax sp. A1169]
MKQLIHWYFKALEGVVVLCLAAMCIMVFGNVVLRHLFDSGINISEELSRFMFIWLIFLGAILAMREGGHLGMDMLVHRLSGKALFAAVLLAQCTTLACCAVLLWGLLRQHALNMANTGLVTGISLGVVYSVAYLCAASIGVMTVVNIVRLLSGRVSPGALVAVSEEGA